MNIVVSQSQAVVPVTIMKLQGELDASNFQDVIDRVQVLYQGGTRHLLIDLSDLSFMSSSGLVALYSAARIMAGAAPPNPEHGWGVFRELEKATEGGLEKHCQLCCPQPAVDRALEITGFKAFLTVHPDMETALGSFG